MNHLDSAMTTSRGGTVKLSEVRQWLSAKQVWDTLLHKRGFLILRLPAQVDPLRRDVMTFAIRIKDEVRVEYAEIKRNCKAKC